MAVLNDAAQLRVLLAGDRVAMLAAVQEPGSAVGLARRLGLPRQQVNYHVRELERAGLVEVVGERRRGNCVERLLQATARRFVVGPGVLGELAAEPREIRDRLSWAHLAAAASRTIGETAELVEGAAAAGERVATLSLEAEMRFASASDRDAFARELSDALARLIVRYHDAQGAGGSCFRVHVGAHPAVAGASHP